MSVASVSGRLRDQRLSANPGSAERIRKARVEQAKADTARFPKSLDQQYMDAWRKAGKPAEFPSMMDWLAQNP